MSKENNLTDYLTDLGDAIREKTGGVGLISPQDFADIIRALPLRGEVDHEWHIYFDDTKPASLYGGDWEELAHGYFLMAAGDGGKAGEKGGENQKTLAVENIPAHRHNQTSFYGGDAVKGDIWTPMEYQIQHGDVEANTSSKTGSVGGGQPFDNRPLYQTAHFWIRHS